jgi:hypothetical protein
MPELDLEALQGYIGSCRKLRRELEHVISDIQFVRDQGGEIRHAVDFSELFAYTLPSETAQEFALLDDADDEALIAMQRNALRRLFYSSGDKIILLKPYAVELQSFLVRSMGGEFDHIVASLPKVLDEVERLHRTADFPRWKQLAEQVVSGDREITEQEAHHFVGFLENHATSVLALLGAEERRPHRMIRQLLQDQRFDELGSLVDVNDSLTAEPDRTWLDGLKARRRERASSTRLDALALSTVERANRILQPRKIRLLLVTRSNSMHTLAEHHCRAQSPPEESFLRHPRVFNVLYSVPTHGEEDGLPRLRGMLEAVDLFLKATRGVGFSTATHHIDADLVQSLLEKIRKDWDATKALSASLVETTEPVSVAWSRTPEEVRNILVLLRDHKELQQALLDRIQTIASGLEREHQLLGLVLQSGNAQEQIMLMNRLSATSRGEVAVLQTVVHSMPYTLEFYTDGARRLLDAFSPAAEDSYGWNEILSLFRQAFGEEADYERLLAMSSVFGTLGKWNLAEAYCETALEQYAGDAHDGVHEGKFFLALCLRKVNVSIDRNLRALQLVEEARESKRRLKGDPEYEDPRYLVEQGTHVLMIHMQSGGQVRITGIPSVSKGLRLLDDAERRAGDDLRLRIQILNNRLYFLLETSASSDRGSLEATYRELFRLQTRAEPAQERWPAAILDTLAWARWRILGPESTTASQDIVRMLRLALRQAGLEASQQQTIERHLALIKSTLGDHGGEEDA